MRTVDTVTTRRGGLAVRATYDPILRLVKAYAAQIDKGSANSATATESAKVRLARLPPLTAA